MITVPVVFLLALAMPDVPRPRAADRRDDASAIIWIGLAVRARDAAARPAARRRRSSSTCWSARSSATRARTSAAARFGAPAALAARSRRTRRSRAWRSGSSPAIAGVLVRRPLPGLAVRHRRADPRRSPSRSPRRSATCSSRRSSATPGTKDTGRCSAPTAARSTASTRCCSPSSPATGSGARCSSREAVPA